MRITKIKIKNLFGISEQELDNKSIELSGQNGVGKTSVIDAIRYALTNKSDRDYIVKNGETEGEILIETDTGLSINRKPRTTQVDFKNIKNNGTSIQSPESFLKDIFTDLQLSPVEFIGWPKDKQNASILDLIQYPWNMDTIKGWFGEIPPDVSYDQNILKVLNDIQREEGYYFRTRQEINRDIRNKRAFIEEIGSTIPSSYQVEKWEKADLGQIYTKIERIRKNNSIIEDARRAIENKDNKIRKFQADKEIALAATEREISARNNQLTNDIIKLTEQVKSMEKERDALQEKKNEKIKLIDAQYLANISRFEAEVEQYGEYAKEEPQDTTELNKEAENINAMKSHINEYKRMIGLQDEVEDMILNSQSLTSKIELARKLPGVILETAKIPVEGLIVKDGIPLIKNGKGDIVPISNLSDGEKLDLCVDVAIAKPNVLQIILIDGIEKLSTDNRNNLYKKCRDKGLQFIAARTTDNAELMVTILEEN